jgi:hypothetical protein
MNIEYLIQLLENKMIVLTNAKTQAFAVGDLNTINSAEAEMVSINDTLYKLRLLLAATQAAESANTDISTMIAAGVETMKSAPLMMSNATECLTQYDITSYATDPLHEQKIADILTYMGAMNSVADVDIYLNNGVVGCPLTGSMIFGAAQEYNVDCRLMMALMELDSHFGTAGIAVSTFNPGNIGNTGTATRTYSSWQAGVEAVAQWLDNHRIKAEEAVVPVETPPEPIVEEPIPIVPVVDTPPEVIPPVETPPIETPTSTEPVVLPPVETPATTTEPIITPPVEVPPTEAPTSTPISKVKSKTGKLFARSSNKNSKTKRNTA